MRIGIIGYGYVGQAVAAAHDRNLLMINDIKFEEWENYPIESIIEHTGWVYVCLPTPMLEDGNCDTSLLKETFDKLKDYEGFVISKSTAPPKFYKEILDQTGPGKKYKFRLLHMPEFLRQNHALQDFMNPQVIVIGGRPNDVAWASLHIIGNLKIYKAKTSMVRTDIATAAAMKYYSNSFLATKVVFNNQFANWCKGQGVEWNNLADCLKEDRRLGPTHYQVPGPDGKFGWAGSCFPKDIAAVLAADPENNLTLLRHQLDVNTQLRAIDTDPPKSEVPKERPRSRRAAVAPTRATRR